MNFSDYDSENYSSDEDADYVPSDDNLSEDDMNECVGEDGVDTEQSEHLAKGVKKKKSRKDAGVRKRKKGGIQLEEESNEEGEGDQQKQEEEDKEAGQEPEAKGGEVEAKKVADDLWATFLRDVDPSSKPAASTSQDKDRTAGKTPSEIRKEEKPKDAAKITITKVYDFAGEEVRVTKEVDTDSKEAKSFLKNEEEKQEEQGQSSKPCVASAAPGPSSKRPAGLGNVLNRIGGKKQKMSTLEKSRLDWDAFKDEEGIREELATHNRGRDGYLERKNFLERVDHRQFELERNVRLSNMKR